MQKAELEMRVTSPPFRLMDVQSNGEGVTHSPVCAETAKGTTVVDLHMLVGILHQSEQLSLPSRNSFPLAAPDSAETLARAASLSALLQEVQLN